MCFFDASDSQSFQNMVSVWLREVAENARPDITVAVVAAKCDLRNQIDLPRVKVSALILFFF
jgi:GTPase SAR1 family protein